MGASSPFSNVGREASPSHPRWNTLSERVLKSGKIRSHTYFCENSIRFKMDFLFFAEGVEIVFRTRVFAERFFRRNLLGLSLVDILWSEFLVIDKTLKSVCSRVAASPRGDKTRWIFPPAGALACQSEHSPDGNGHPCQTAQIVEAPGF